MITVENAIEQFLLACKANGLKPATIRWYASMLKPVGIEMCGIPIDLVNSTHTRQYIVELRSRDHRYQDASQRKELKGGLSADSLRGHVTALRSFFQWCQTEYQLPQTWNPMRNIRKPSTDRKLPKAISLEDLQRLLFAIKPDRKGIRDKAMLVFLADTGCRAGGVLGLKVADLHMHSRRAMVTEKGDRVRTIYFSHFTATLLAAWLKVMPKSEFVFCSLGNELGQQLTHSGLNQILRRLKDRSGVRGRVNPHSFRHYFAINFILEGGDLASLAQIMGHSSVTVTESYYARFADDELAARHRKFSPVRRLDTGK